MHSINWSRVVTLLGLCNRIATQSTPTNFCPGPCTSSNYDPCFVCDITNLFLHRLTAKAPTACFNPPQQQERATQRKHGVCQAEDSGWSCACPGASTGRCGCRCTVLAWWAWCVWGWGTELTVEGREGVPRRAAQQQRKSQAVMCA